MSLYISRNKKELILIIVFIFLAIFFNQRVGVISFKETNAILLLVAALMLLMAIIFSAQSIKIALQDLLYASLMGTIIIVLLFQDNHAVDDKVLKTLSGGFLAYTAGRLFYVNRQAWFQSVQLAKIGLVSVLMVIAIHIYFSVSVTQISGLLYNTTLYANYLSLLVCFCYYLKSKVRDDTVSALLNIIIGLSTLIALVNNARIAVIVGCLAFVVYLNYLYRFSILKKIAGILTLLLLAVATLFMKERSSSGRLLIWNITTKIIAEHPLGIGAGHFMTVYNLEQSKYLNSQQASAHDKLVADVDENAFNDFLQLSAEASVLAGALYVALLASAFVAIKNVFGKLLVAAWVLLSCFSYPQYVFLINATFNVMLAWFITRYVSGLNVQLKFGYHKKLIVIILLVTIMTGVGIDIYVYNIWRKEQAMHFRNFDTLTPFIKQKLLNENSFLYNYGRTLMQSGHYAASIDVLTQSNNWTFDDDLNVAIAMCFEKKHHFSEAERYYKRAVFIHPNKFIPKSYLLDFYLLHDAVKARHLAADVIRTPVKVKSRYIDSLKYECRRIVLNKDVEEH